MNLKFPKLICAGFPHSGTTSLYYYLTQHPRLMQGSKENYWFDRYFLEPQTLSEGLYLKRINQGEGDIALDFSPTYVYNPMVPMRLYQKCPEDFKVIILIRDPTDRCISQKFIPNTNEPKSAKQIEKWEYDKMNKISNVRGSTMDQIWSQTYNYPIEGSKYINFIKPWVEDLGDKLWLIRSEDFFEDPAGVCRGIFKWLGIDPIMVDTSQVWGSSRNRIGELYREQLDKLFKPWNKKLNEYLGKRMCQNC